MRREQREPAVWFPAIRAGTGADVFTQRLRDGLIQRDIRAEITWLPHHAEYLPWAVSAPRPPSWANVVHINTWLHSRFISRRQVVVATAHHCVHDPALSPYKSVIQSCYHRFWIRRLEALALRRAHKVVAISKYTLQKFQDEFDARGMQVIYNGVAIPDGSCSAPRVSSTKFRLLYVGGWSRRKGVDILGQIMRRLGDGYELVYTQSGPRLRGQKDLPPNCRSLGRLSHHQLEKAYRESDVLVFPSRLEGFGLVVAEAMASGLPVVASDSSALPEVIDDGETGLLCTMDDVDSFVEAIRFLSTNERIRTAMGVAGRERVRRRFSEERMIDAYVSCYRELLASGNKDLINAKSAEPDMRQGAI